MFEKQYFWFPGAIDSAVPCAQMINLAHTMKMDLDDHKGQIKI